MVSSPKNNKPIDNIAAALNVEPTEIKKIEPEIDHIDDDYEYARGNMITMIEKGNDALENMINFATAGQSARGFEVVATLMKTLADSNKDLLELTRKKQNLEASSGKKVEKVTNNNLFVGSTAELQQMLKEMKKE